MTLKSKRAYEAIRPCRTLQTALQSHETPSDFCFVLFFIFKSIIEKNEEGCVIRLLFCTHHKRARCFVRQPPARAQRDVLLSAHQNLKKRCIIEALVRNCFSVEETPGLGSENARQRCWIKHLGLWTQTRDKLQWRDSVSIQTKNNHYHHIFQEETCSVTLWTQKGCRFTGHYSRVPHSFTRISQTIPLSCIGEAVVLSMLSRSVV